MIVSINRGHRKDLLLWTGAQLCKQSLLAFGGCDTAIDGQTAWPVKPDIIIRPCLDGPTCCDSGLDMTMWPAIHAGPIR